MTTAVLSDRQIRDLVWQNVQTLTISKDVYKKTLGRLAGKLKDPIPPAKNPAFQVTMNKTYAAYRELIQGSMGIAKAQYKLGKGITAIFQAEMDLPTITEHLTDFRCHYSELLQVQTTNEALVNSLIDRILELMTTDNPVS